MKWISDNLGTLIALLSQAVILILALGRNLWLTSQINQKVDKLENDLAKTEEKFTAHISAPSLHRTPDSEARLTRIETYMAEMNTKLDRLVGQKLGGD
jgi:hypothetical protein